MSAIFTLVKRQSRFYSIYSPYIKFSIALDGRTLVLALLVTRRFTIRLLHSSAQPRRSTLTTISEMKNTHIFYSSQYQAIQSERERGEDTESDILQKKEYPSPCSTHKWMLKMRERRNTTGPASSSTSEHSSSLSIAVGLYCTQRASSLEFASTFLVVNASRWGMAI